MTGIAMLIKFSLALKNACCKASMSSFIAWMSLADILPFSFRWRLRWRIFPRIRLSPTSFKVFPPDTAESDCIAGINLFLFGLVFGSKTLGFLNRLLDLVLGQVGRRSDRDVLFTVGSQIFNEHVNEPFASISKVTSIWGIPRGAGAMPSRLNRPRVLLCCANSRFPCRT